MKNEWILFIVLLLLMFFLVVFYFKNDLKEGISNMDDDNIASEINKLHIVFQKLIGYLQELLFSVKVYSQYVNSYSKTKISSELPLLLETNYNDAVTYSMSLPDVTKMPEYNTIIQIHEKKKQALAEYKNKVDSENERYDNQLIKIGNVNANLVQQYGDEEYACFADRLSKDENDFSTCIMKYNTQISSLENKLTTQMEKNYKKTHQYNLLLYTEAYDMSMSYYNSFIDATTYTTVLLPLKNKLQMNVEFFLGGVINNERFDGFIQDHVMEFLTSSTMNDLIPDQQQSALTLYNGNNTLSPLSQPPALPKYILVKMQTLINKSIL